MGEAQAHKAHIRPNSSPETHTQVVSPAAVTEESLGSLLSPASVGALLRLLGPEILPAPGSNFFLPPGKEP